MAKKAKKITPETKKQIFRREREQRQTRQLYLALGIIALISLAVLGYFYYRQTYGMLNEFIASVNGTPIYVRDYQALLRSEYRNTYATLLQYQQTLTQIGDDPALASLRNQYEQQLNTEANRLVALPNSAMEDAIDDELIRQEAQKQGLTVTAAEVDQGIERLVKTSLGYTLPTPTATNGPSPTASLTPTITRTPTTTDTPTLLPSPTATLSQTATATETLGPTDTPQPTFTPLSPEAYQNELTSYLQNIQKNLEISIDDYRKLVEKNLLRQKFNAYLQAKVPTTGSQVHARGIVVNDMETANKAVERLKKGEAFVGVAKDVSLDPSVSENGGDFGWILRPATSNPVLDALFNLEANQVSEPISTTSGVYIVQAVEKDANHPLSEAQLQQEKNTALTDWLSQARGTAKIERFFRQEYVPADIRKLIQDFQQQQQSPVNLPASQPTP